MPAPPSQRVFMPLQIDSVPLPPHPLANSLDLLRRAMAASYGSKAFEEAAHKHPDLALEFGGLAETNRKLFDECVAVMPDVALRSAMVRDKLTKKQFDAAVVGSPATTLIYRLVKLLTPKQFAYCVQRAPEAAISSCPDLLTLSHWMMRMPSWNSCMSPVTSHGGRSKRQLTSRKITKNRWIKLSRTCDSVPSKSTSRWPSSTKLVRTGPIPCAGR